MCAIEITKIKPLCSVEVKVRGGWVRVVNLDRYKPMYVRSMGRSFKVSDRKPAAYGIKKSVSA